MSACYHPKTMRSWGETYAAVLRLALARGRIDAVRLARDLGQRSREQWAAVLFAMFRHGYLTRLRCGRSGRTGSRPAIYGPSATARQQRCIDSAIGL